MRVRWPALYDGNISPTIIVSLSAPAIVTSAICLAAIAAGCGEPPPRDLATSADLVARTSSEDDVGVDTASRDSVVAELRRYYADFSARDWTAFSDHFWPGATLTTVWQPPGSPSPRVEIITIPEFVRRAPDGPGSKPIFDEQMDSVRVRVSGNLAQAWAFYTARFGDSTSVATWRGVDAFTIMYHDGRWRITSLAYASEP